MGRISVNQRKATLIGDFSSQTLLELSVRLVLSNASELVKRFYLYKKSTGAWSVSNFNNVRLADQYYDYRDKTNSYTTTGHRYTLDVFSKGFVNTAISFVTTGLTAEDPSADSFTDLIYSANQFRHYVHLGYGFAPATGAISATLGYKTAFSGGEQQTVIAKPLFTSSGDYGVRNLRVTYDTNNKLKVEWDAPASSGRMIKSKGENSYGIIIYNRKAAGTWYNPAKNYVVGPSYYPVFTFWDETDKTSYTYTYTKALQAGTTVKVSVYSYHDMFYTQGVSTIVCSVGQISGGTCTW